MTNTFWIGAATAAHQVERNNTNSDFWVMENLPQSTFTEPSGLACDHDNRYEEDILYLDLNAYCSVITCRASGRMISSAYRITPSRSADWKNLSLCWKVRRSRGCEFIRRTFASIKTALQMASRLRAIST